MSEFSQNVTLGAILVLLLGYVFNYVIKPLIGKINGNGNGNSNGNGNGKNASINTQLIVDAINRLSDSLNKWITESTKSHTEIMCGIEELRRYAEKK